MRRLFISWVFFSVLSMTVAACPVGAAGLDWAGHWELVTADTSCEVRLDISEVSKTGLSFHVGGQCNGIVDMYDAKAVIQGDRAVEVVDETADSECRLTMTLANGSIRAGFYDCGGMGGFGGTYKKINKQKAPVAPVPALPQLSPSTVPTLKVKGVYIGMPWVDWCVFLGERFGHQNVRDMTKPGEVYSEDEGGFLASAEFDEDKKIKVIQFVDRAVDKLFNTDGMSPVEFAKSFQEAYQIPPFEFHEDKEAWISDSPAGVRVVVTTDKRLLMLKNIVAPKEQKKPSFD